MCGRFTLRTPMAVLLKEIAFDAGAELFPRYNIAPTQSVAAVRQGADEKRQLAMLRWGLIPFWSKDAAIGNRLINARADTVAEKPSFREAFKRRRCLILADGYYEWQAVGKVKQPYLIGYPDHRPFAIAGLWERWQPPTGDQAIESCTIITTDATGPAQAIHDRMPAILQPDDYDLWLSTQTSSPEALKNALQRHAADDLTAVAVSTTVNNPRHEGPACIEPVQPV